MAYMRPMKDKSPPRARYDSPPIGRKSQRHPNIVSAHAAHYDSPPIGRPRTNSDESMSPMGSRDKKKPLEMLLDLRMLQDKHTGLHDDHQALRQQHGSLQRDFTRVCEERERMREQLMDQEAAYRYALASSKAAEAQAEASRAELELETRNSLRMRRSASVEKSAMREASLHGWKEMVVVERQLGTTREEAREARAQARVLQTELTEARAGPPPNPSAQTRAGTRAHPPSPAHGWPHHRHAGARRARAHERGAGGGARGARADVGSAERDERRAERGERTPPPLPSALLSTTRRATTSVPDRHVRSPGARGARRRADGGALGGGAPNAAQRGRRPAQQLLELPEPARQPRGGGQQRRVGREHAVAAAAPHRPSPLV